MYYEHMDIAELLGGSVARQLEAKRLTVQDLHRMTDIPYTTLRRKVRGLDEFRFSELVLVAEALGIKPSDLVPTVFKEQVSA